MRHIAPVRARRSGIYVLSLITLLGLTWPPSLVARTSPTRAQTSDDALLTRGYLVDARLAAALDTLLKRRVAGEPFAIQEIEILDAWEAYLPIAKIEADVLVSRAIDTVFMRGVPARKVGNDLVARWRAYATAHAVDLQARNLKLNAGLEKNVQPPDGTREWELYFDPMLFNQLSSAYQNRLQLKYGHKGKAGAAARSAAAGPTLLDTPTNVTVNNRTVDATVQDTQSETAIAIGSGTNVLSSFNDSGSDLSPNASFTGIARSTDGGASFTDNGRLPASSASDAGDPVYARNSVTGRAILATLGFNSASVLQTFRTDDNGATFSAPTDADGGGTNNDKEWITCDNFAGTGQGNFYLFYRDFGSGGGMSFTRSTSGGTAWSSRIVLASDSGQGAFPVVGADHAVYAFWLAGTSIVVRKSTDQGATFGSQTTVVNLVTSGTNGDLGLTGGFRTNAFPQVVCDPNNANRLYCVFNDVGQAAGDKADVYLTSSTDGGATWSPKRRVNTDATTTDQWQPTIAIAPDGSAVWVSWYDRRGDGSLIGLYGTDGTICADGSLTLVADYAISDGTWPIVIGQDPVIVSTYMGDYDQSTADNTACYRQWGDNRLANTSHSHQPDVRFAKIPKSPPSAFVPQLGANGATIAAESCTPANNAIDPGETVTVGFAIKNAGGTSTSNLVGTLLATGGVTSPSGPQTYGSVSGCSGTVAKSFTFTASGSCGGTLTASLQLQDGPTSYGTLTYVFSLGAVNAVPQAFSNSAAITINDNAAATPYPSTIAVSGVTAGISRVTVSLNGLTHTYPADIDILLVGPGGQKSIVMSDAGGSSNVSNITFTIDPNASATVPEPIANGGVYKPTDGDGSDTFPPPAPAGSAVPNFSVFGGLSGSAVNGAWSLYVKDDAIQDAGSISGGWTLNVYTFTCATSCGAPNQPPVANAGADQAVDACTRISLNGGASSDPDGGPSPLTYAWSQTAGPTVTISGANTSAPSLETPNVASQAVLTFQLTVSDGAAMSSDSVDVTVNHVSGVNVDTVGITVTGANTFFLRNCNAPGPADVNTSFGVGGWVPLRGDWDGNGTETEGAYDPTTSCFFLRNSNTPGPADAIVCFGAPGSVPLVGDWDGDGTVTIGTYDAASGTFFLKNSLAPGDADVVFTYGAPNLTPITGDWDGNGTTTVGVYYAAASTFFLRNSNTSGVGDLVFTYGVGGLGAVPLAGDWDGVGGDSVGLYFPSSGFFFLKNSNAPGPADLGFQFGPAGGTFTPLAGDWDGF